MRSAPSFLLSLLLFVAITGAQIVALWPTASQEELAPIHVVQLMESGVDVLQEFEDDVELDSTEFSIHRVPRTVEVNPAQEDKNELFGPPEQIAVAVADAQVTPQAHVVYLTTPWLDSMLRPPIPGLPTAG